MENNFSENPEFFKSILEGMPYGVVAIDKSGKIIIFNQSALSILNVEQKNAGITGTGSQWH